MFSENAGWEDGKMQGITADRITYGSGPLPDSNWGAYTACAVEPHVTTGPHSSLTLALF